MAQDHPIELIKIARVISLTGLSRPSVYRLARQGDFPKPTKLGVRSSAWALCEIEAWIRGRLAERDERVAS